MMPPFEVRYLPTAEKDLNEIFDYIDQTPINQKRGEKELPDLVQCAIDDNEGVYYHILASTYVNVNTRDDVTVVNKLVLDDAAE